MGPTPRIVVVVNTGSGAGADAGFADRLALLFRQAGAEAAIRTPRRGDEIASAVREALRERPAIIVAAGGDGTVSSVASVLCDSGIALGVLPTGTLNHFAKDLGLPLDLEAAVDTIVRGAVRRVDVGEVNGRVFVNNSGLGLYPDIVVERERQQRRLGLGKWRAFANACVVALRRYPFLAVRMRIDGDDRHYRTPFVFIGNNDYLTKCLAIGQRNSLDDGVLSLYVARRPGRWRLLQFALRALVGKLREARDFDVLHASEIVVESRDRTLRVSTDGEVVSMTLPLRYRVRCRALRVVVRATDATQPT